MTTKFKRTGGRSVRNPHKGYGPKYLNKTAFKHNKNSKKTRRILALPNEGLCSKCTDIVEWRKKYRKYKELREAKKCSMCLNPGVLFAYHILCQACAQNNGICAKCKVPMPVKKDANDCSATESIEEEYEEDPCDEEEVLVNATAAALSLSCSEEEEEEDEEAALGECENL